MLAFDTHALEVDPSHAAFGEVPVGIAPVGINVIEGGRKIVVTNSNRFQGAPSDKQSLTVIDSSRVSAGSSAVVGSIEARAFPREIRITADGHTILLTNYGSKSLELVNITNLPLIGTPP
ncbi:MAG: hypothetical protein ACYCZX_07800 [Rhodospirillaceae bacterium]